MRGLVGQVTGGHGGLLNPDVGYPVSGQGENLPLEDGDNVCHHLLDISVVTVVDTLRDGQGAVDDDGIRRGVEQGEQGDAPGGGRGADGLDHCGHGDSERASVTADNLRTSEE